MSNPYSFFIDDLMVVVYATTKAEAEKKFIEAMDKHDSEVRADAIDECINKLCFSKIISYRSEDVRRILEELKEEKNDTE